MVLARSTLIVESMTSCCCICYDLVLCGCADGVEALSAQKEFAVASIVLARHMSVNVISWNVFHGMSFILVFRL